jgi:hypothetical protein
LGGKPARVFGGINVKMVFRPKLFYGLYAVRDRRMPEHQRFGKYEHIELPGLERSPSKYGNYAKNRQPGPLQELIRMQHTGRMSSRLLKSSAGQKSW